MADADVKEEEKTKIFRDFENSTSQKRVILGTKLISNGLDCPSVRFVCLADCLVDPIDYLQMIGRIRKGGYVHIIDVESNKKPPQLTELRFKLDTLDWDICITKQIAKFYSVPYNGHNLCCNNGVDSGIIKEVRDALKVAGKKSGREFNIDGPPARKTAVFLPLHIRKSPLIQHINSNNHHSTQSLLWRRISSRRESTPILTTSREDEIPTGANTSEDVNSTTLNPPSSTQATNSELSNNTTTISKLSLTTTHNNDCTESNETPTHDTSLIHKSPTASPPNGNLIVTDHANQPPATSSPGNLLDEYIKFPTDSDDDFGMLATEANDKIDQMFLRTSTGYVTIKAAQMTTKNKHLCSSYEVAPIKFASGNSINYYNERSDVVDLMYNNNLFSKSTVVTEKNNSVL